MREYAQLCCINYPLPLLTIPPQSPLQPRHNKHPQTNPRPHRPHLEPHRRLPQRQLLPPLIQNIHIRIHHPTHQPPHAQHVHSPRRQARRISCRNRSGEKGEGFEAICCAGFGAEEAGASLRVRLVGVEIHGRFGGRERTSSSKSAFLSVSVKSRGYWRSKSLKPGPERPE